MSLQSNLPEQIVSKIQSVIGNEPAALHEPSFNANEWLYVKDCLDSTFVSSVGGYIDRFEFDLANFTGAKHAIAVVNGTSALHIALKLAGVGPGDEVMVPALTFVATANAITYCNATPHFLDSEPVTLGIFPAKLREYLDRESEQRSGVCFNRSTGRVIRALVPMHTFGHPVDLDGLLAISHDYKIPLVEDAAESLGSYYCGKHTGTFGLFGTLSFNGNKIITTGGGGAILTNDSGLASHAKHLIATAKNPHLWEFNHDQIGYNYRLPSLNAALGCAQLEQLSLKLNAKRDLYKLYSEVFSDLEGIKLFSEPAKCCSNYWLQTLLLDEKCSDQRDLILMATNKSGIMTRPAWKLLNELDPFKNAPHMDLSEAQKLVRCLINIPSSPGLVPATA